MSEITKGNASPELQAIEAAVAHTFPLPSVRRVMLVTLLTVVVGLGGLLGWAIATPIDRAVIATGSLIAEGRRKTVTVLESAILRELAVKEGEHVRAGQVLIQLDTTVAQAQADQSRAQYWGGVARIARLEAETRDAREWRVPPEAEQEARLNLGVAALINSERQLFSTRWEAFDGASSVQERQIAQIQAQIAALPQQRAAVGKQLVALRERLRGYSSLAQQGIGSRFQVLQIQEAEANYESQLAQLTAQEAAMTQQIAQARFQLAQLRLTRQQEVATDLQTTQAQVALIESQLRQALDILRRREVVAPEDGVVTNIQFFTPGSALAAGQPIMDLVPAQDRLVVEAQVSTTDVEVVYVGQPANVRLLPFRQRNTPLVPGQVIYVSPDKQVLQGTNQPYYVARIELDQSTLAALPSIALTAGMPTENFLLGQRHSAASYILTPIRDSLRRAFRD
jgi:HlyD family secretion protein